MKTQKRIYTNSSYSAPDERCVIIGEYIAETGATVRQTAKEYGVSKSTVHKDVTERLKYCNRGLYQQVQKILHLNGETKHIHGGQATKDKFETLRQLRPKTKIAS